MQKFMALVAAVVLTCSVLLVGGCGQSGPVGTWVVDSDATFAAMEKAMGKDMPAELKPMLEQMRAQASKNAPDVTMTFRSDGTFEVTEKGKSRKGTWKLASGKLELTGEGEKPSATAVRFAGGRMYVSPPEGDRIGPLGKMEIAFKRK